MTVRTTAGRLLDLPPDEAVMLIERGEAVPVRRDHDHETPERHEADNLETRICDCCV